MALSSALKLWGVTESRVHTEAFGAADAFSPGVIDDSHKPPPHAPEGSHGEGPNVAFTRSNLVVPWDTRFTSLLEFAEAWYAPEPLDLPAAGNALLCCGVPVTEIQLDL